jgi:hypothetical protein
MTLLELDAIQDNHHVRELIAILEFLQVRQHALVHKVGTEDEHAHVRETAENGGIGHDTSRDSVDENDLVTFTQIGHNLVQAFAGEKFGRIRR